MKFMVGFLLIHSLSITSFGAECFQAIYSGPSKARAAREFLLKVDGKQATINLIDSSGKRYVHDSYVTSSSQGIRAEENPYGEFTLHKNGSSYQFSTSEIRYREINSFCNNWFQCKDQYSFYIIQPINLFHTMKMIPCHSIQVFPYEGPKTDSREGADLNLNVTGRLSYTLKKQTDFTPSQRKKYQFVDSQHGNWLRFYELSRAELNLNGKNIGVRKLIESEKHALAFSPEKDLKISILNYAAETQEEFLEIRDLSPKAVHWKSGSFRIASAELSGALDGLPILGDYVSRSENPDHFSLHLATQIKQFFCRAQDELSEVLECRIQMNVRGSFSL
jgi:hypothetical protein